MLFQLPVPVPLLIWLILLAGCARLGFLLFVLGKRLAQIRVFSLSQTASTASAGVSRVPVSRQRLFWMLVWTTLLAPCPLIRPLRLTYHLLRTARPYTPREKAWMIALDGLQALVEIGVLFPARLMGFPRRWRQALAQRIHLPLYARQAAIESADHIIDWLNAASVSE